jgi:hypothetical protein
MGFVGKVEAKLDVWLRQKAPVQLPPEGRQGLANALWWISLLVGLVQLWGAWVLWHLGHFAAETNQAYLDEVYGAQTAPVELGLFYWLSFACVALVAVLMLVASPNLKRMRKAGWNLLFYAILFNAVFALLRLFSGVDGSIPGFVGSVVGTVLGAYLLFQTRDQFSGKRTARPGPEDAPQSKK